MDVTEIQQHVLKYHSYEFQSELNEELNESKILTANHYVILN